MPQVKWEYKVIAIRGYEPALYEVHMNQLGADGWECFLVESGLGYFKRPRATTTSEK